MTLATVGQVCSDAAVGFCKEVVGTCRPTVVRTCRTITLGSESIESTLTGAHARDQPGVATYARAAIQITGLFAPIIEEICSAVGVSDKTLALIRKAEIGVKAVNLTLCISEASSDKHSASYSIRSGFVAPALSLTRSVLNHLNQTKLCASKEESPDQTALGVGVDVITVIEGVNNVANLNDPEAPINSKNQSSYTDLLARIGVQNEVLATKKTEIDRLMGALHRFAEDPTNLSNLPAIPERLQTDFIFERYICPLTYRPIRDPVGDPTDTRYIADRTHPRYPGVSQRDMHMYERAAIIKCIETTGRSPMTRKPLRVEDLVELPEIQSQINRQLGFHSNNYQRCLERAVTERP